MRLALAALLLPLAAAQDPAREKSWFPTRPGTTWSYQGPGQLGNSTFTILAPAKVGDADCTVIEQSAEPMGMIGRGRRYYRVEAGQVSLVATANEGVEFKIVELESPEVILKLPLKAGDTWKTVGGCIGVTYSVEGPVKIKTPLGEIECLKVRRDTNVKSCELHAEGIGLVARIHAEGTRSETRIVLALFKPGPAK